MNHTDRAIKLAIERGYEGTPPTSTAFLDKNFWVALGKRLGWSIYAVCKEDGEVDCHSLLHFTAYPQEWLYHWHPKLLSLLKKSEV